jgi:hypothetical protein
LLKLTYDSDIKNTKFILSAKFPHVAGVGRMNNSPCEKHGAVQNETTCLDDKITGRHSQGQSTHLKQGGCRGYANNKRCTATEERRTKNEENRRKSFGTSNDESLP